MHKLRLLRISDIHFPSLCERGMATVGGGHWGDVS